MKLRDRIDNADTLHTWMATKLDYRSNSYNINKPSYPCGCTPLIHRFKCFRCKRWVGWCMGVDDELPNHCDDCWHKTYGQS